MYEGLIFHSSSSLLPWRFDIHVQKSVVPFCLFIHPTIRQFCLFAFNFPAHYFYHEPTPWYVICAVHRLPTHKFKNHLLFLRISARISRCHFPWGFRKLFVLIWWLHLKDFCVYSFLTWVLCFSRMPRVQTAPLFLVWSVNYVRWTREVICFGHSLVSFSLREYMYIRSCSFFIFRVIRVLQLTIKFLYDTFERINGGLRRDF